MRFLVDNAMSPVVASGLVAAGHDALHVRDIGMAKSADEEIFTRAVLEDRVVVSQDTDFGTILALRREIKPSVILFRTVRQRSPAQQAATLVLIAANMAETIAQGCVLVVEDARLRIRPLPIDQDR